jgi:hypothetical protein
MTDHDDTGALAAAILAVLPNRCCEPGEACPYDAHDADRLANAILASDWLAAYVARRVEAERECDERGRVIERVTALLADRSVIGTLNGHEVPLPMVHKADLRDALAPATHIHQCASAGYPGHEPSSSCLCICGERFDGRNSAIEPASDRPLIVDAALAEVERRIGLRACITGTDRHLDIVRDYREKVRRG